MTNNLPEERTPSELAFDLEVQRAIAKSELRRALSVRSFHNALTRALPKRFYHWLGADAESL